MNRRNLIKFTITVPLFLLFFKTAVATEILKVNKNEKINNNYVEFNKWIVTPDIKKDAKQKKITIKKIVGNLDNSTSLRLTEMLRYIKKNFKFW